MARNRARIYIEKLRGKGWEDKSIREYCRINEVRFNHLATPAAIPTRIEVKRLHMMMRRPTEEAMKIIKEVWGSKKVEKPEDDAPTDFTPRQKETLHVLATAQRNGNGAALLARTDASIAARMKPRGITRIEEVEAGGKKFRRYGLTDLGVRSCRKLGISVD